MLWGGRQGLDLRALGGGEKYLVHTFSLNYPLQPRKLLSLCFPGKKCIYFVLNMKILAQFR